MKKLVLALLLSSFCLSVSAGPQQEKMKTCNADASTKALKGDDRKAFMKTCLSADSADSGLTAQQNKMKTCNADAKTKALKGDDRKAFMKTCLSGK
ncbi:MAG TPA: PsiF family protein [Methylophilus sp.]|nr:PsiF family protein [Methylophilus sp.]